MKGTGPRPTGAAADGCFEQQLAGLGSFNDFEAAFPVSREEGRVPLGPSFGRSPSPRRFGACASPP